MPGEAHDPQTLAYYAQEAEVYATRKPAKRGHLEAFLERLPPGAAILELGCGAGHDAQQMLSRGFDITATDAVPAFVAIAEVRLGRPVRLMRFDELTDEACYDAVWANASLHHAPLAELAGILARIFRALKPGGSFYAGYKGGEGEGRDGFGRYYSFAPAALLTRIYEAAAAWSELELTEARGSGYDGVERPWSHVFARKPAAAATPE